MPARNLRGSRCRPAEFSNEVLGEAEASRELNSALQAAITELESMIDLKQETLVSKEIDVDTGTLAAIDNGAKAADEGRTVPLDEVREMIPKWISEFEARNRR
jgi:predicted transcriptional regulator